MGDRYSLCKHSSGWNDLSQSIKDCYSKKWISYEFSKTCTAKDCIKAVEKAYAIRFPDGNHHDLILRTDNGPQYISEVFKNTVKIPGIRSEYIQKHTPEDNGDIESFHNSLKTDYIWINDLETFEDAENLMEHAFTDCRLDMENVIKKAGIHSKSTRFLS